MNAVELHQYIENPALLTEDTLADIRQAMEAYPFFPVLKILYLQNLWKVNSPDFKQELERLAIGIPNRKQLHILLKGSPFENEQISFGKPDPQSSFDLIDAFLADPANQWNGGDDADALLKEATVSTDYFRSLAVMQDGPPDGAEAKPEGAKLKNQDLIDSFLENEHSRKPVWLTEETEEMPAPEEDEFSLKQLDDSYFTETLARIYVKQKRYEKALHIIKKLSLKYPEKNIYFADQIRFLEKLIINTKK